jgi:hypothetical protein
MLHSLCQVMGEESFNLGLSTGHATHETSAIAILPPNSKTVWSNR